MPIQPSPPAVLLLLFVSVAGLTACSTPVKQSPPPPSAGTTATAATPVDQGSEFKLAQVESVTATVDPANPSGATVQIKGLLHDGATRVHEVQQQRLADGFVLTVITARPRRAVASLALIPFERSVTLDLTGMPKGPCRIVANGVAAEISVP